MPAGGFDVARRDETDHRGEPGDVDSGLEALRAAKREIDHVHAAGCDHAPGGLARDGRLERDQIEEHRLDQLRLGQWCGDLQDRLARERDAALRDRPDVAGEPQTPERLEVARLVPQRVAEVADVVLLEPKILKPVEARLDAGGDEESARGR